MLHTLYRILNVFVRLADQVNATLGRALAITPLLLMLVQFSLVLMVYVFAIGSVMIQESLQYINALMFLGAVGYTALSDDHVRVDIFYSRMKPLNKDWVNLLGSIFLLLPTLWVLWSLTIPYVMESWSILEGSNEAGGLPLVYLLKSTILLFCFSLSLAVFSSIIRLSAKKACGLMSGDAQ